jgi:invasin B
MTAISSVSPQILQAAIAAKGFGQAPAAIVDEIQAAAVSLLSAAAAANLAAGTDAAAPPAHAPELRQPSSARATAQGVGTPSAQLAGTPSAQGVGTPATTGAGTPAGPSVPLGGDQRLTPEAQLTLLVGQLTELLQDTSVETATARVELLKAQRENQKASFERLSKSLDQAEALLGVKIDEAQDAGDDALRTVKAANDAAARVDQLQAQLDATSPSDPNRADLAAQLQQARTQSEQLRTKAQAALVRSDKANDEVLIAQAEVNRIDADIELQITSAPPSLSPPRTLTNAAKLQELLATLNQVVSQSSLAKLQSDTKLAQDQLKSQEAENMRRSKEFEAKQAKAAHLEKVMGCIGKIVGWLITIVAVIAAPFSGGASLALAVVGLALAIAEEATGFSVVGKAFEPIMQHVIMPLINAISKVVTQLLEKAGVDPATAKKVGSILGAIIGAVAIVAAVVVVVVVGRSAAANLLKQITPMVNKLVSGVVPQILKDAGSALSTSGAKLGGAVAKAIGSSAENMGTRVGKALVATQVAQFATTVGTGAGNAIAADVRVEAEGIMAQLLIGLENSKLIREALEDAQQQFIKSNEVALSFLSTMSDVAERARQSGSLVAHNIRTA